jgi:hypothetical protein
MYYIQYLIAQINLNLVLVLFEMTYDWATRRQMKLNLLHLIHGLICFKMPL